MTHPGLLTGRVIVSAERGNGRQQVGLVDIASRWLLGRRCERALRSAEALDEIVDSEVLLPALPEERRRRAADRLAELVLLSQAYRHYANGWLSWRELQRRSKAVLLRLESSSVHRNGATHRA